MLSYPEKLAKLALIYSRNEKENGKAYALSELRHMLNALSAEILQEQQATRDRPVNLLEIARADWNGETR